MRRSVPSEDQASIQKSWSLQAGERRVRQRAAARTPSQLGAIAVRILQRVEESESRRLVYVASSASRAERLAEILGGLAPELDPIHFPPWDCLPYDRALPSRRIMGIRLALLHNLACKRPQPKIILSSPDALIQRVLPPKLLAKPPLNFKKGWRLKPAELNSALLAAGYIQDQRVDEPGEFSIRGKVIDIFPGASTKPMRIQHDGSAVTEMVQFDPFSQLSEHEVEEISILPTIENEPGGKIHTEGKSGAGPWTGSTPGSTFFDYVPDAELVVEAKVEERRRVAMSQISEAFEAFKATKHPDASHGIAKPASIYLNDGEWTEKLSNSLILEIDETFTQAAVPQFAIEEDPDAALAAFARRELKSGRRIVMAGANDKILAAMKRRIDRVIGKQTPRADLDSWRDATTTPKRSISYFKIDLDRGFVDQDAAIVVIAARDLIGSRAREGSEPSASSRLPEHSYSIGGAVIHLDHGLGILRGIAPIASEGEFDAVVLEYAGDEKLLTPIDELDRLWPYGSEPTISPDRLGSDSWQKRKAMIEVEIAKTARHFHDLARQRDQQRAAKLIPPQPAYEAFVARFPFTETPDQSKAIGDTLQDLGSGRRMDRLICGDVGFGKTEVALRAAAVAALSGKQVAVIAPTTVLVRQHVQVFQRRFRGFDVKIAELSRAVSPPATRVVKNELKDGTINIVIGTHALIGKDVGFKDLGLIVIDEEQRFGTAQKKRLAAITGDAHALTLTATPIPRTLQAALVGIHQFSILATPPFERQPIRTLFMAMEDAVLRNALTREHRRGGQSFVVCPRIADLKPMQERLERVVPDLGLLVVHGRMPANALDDTILRFAEGGGDVLLTTNIIENGLDLPSANTMLIWRADRFGLAQLHQLRGRVGRSKVRGTIYLLTDPDAKIGGAALRRLEVLADRTNLGAGVDISSHDLDLRGPGDLLGEEQAGHIKLIGPALHRDLFNQALLSAQGIRPPDVWSPKLNLAMNYRIPEAYIPEVELRIDVYARLARVSTIGDVEALRVEIESRFGSPPSSVDHLLERALLRQLCRELHVERIDAGPQGIAMTFLPGNTRKKAKQLALRSNGTLKWTKGRLLYPRTTARIEQRQRLLIKLLRKLRRALG